MAIRIIKNTNDPPVSIEVSGSWNVGKFSFIQMIASLSRGLIINPTTSSAISILSDINNGDISAGMKQNSQRNSVRRFTLHVFFKQCRSNDFTESQSDGLY